jgi:hypothetical protein
MRTKRSSLSKILLATICVEIFRMNKMNKMEKRLRSRAANQPALRTIAVMTAAASPVNVQMVSASNKLVAYLLVRINSLVMTAVEVSALSVVKIDIAMKVNVLLDLSPLYNAVQMELVDLVGSAPA